jgi:nucleoside-diphosphate-sugar epimerase
MALILGATGGVGGSTARALAERGWQLRTLHRHPELVDTANLPPIEVRHGDALDGRAVMEAADGAELIFHGLNPSRYRNWKGLALPMLESTLLAARSSGARILFPGTVYNYGPDVGALVAEDAPQAPVTRKGRIRVAMEQRLAEEAERGVRSIILRAGDYFGGNAPSSWLPNAIVRPGQPVRRVIYPGDRNVGHAWAYLPDLGEAFAALAEIEQQLPAFDRFHFEGHWLERGGDFAQCIAEIVGGNPPITQLPWFAMRLAAPFNESLREALEVRELWYRPLRLDGTRLRATLGNLPHTPLAAALRQSLRELGCLKAESDPRGVTRWQTAGQAG